MRFQLNKLSKGHSTKAERKFAELLKANHIPFRSKVKIAGREVDFLVWRYAIDIDAHGQSLGKNEMLVREGYIPLHFLNENVNKIKELNFLKYANTTKLIDGV
jgi:hypothetical protein